MVRPTFFVYDTMERFNKHVLYNGNPLSRTPIKNILLPENGAFWFYTDITKDLESVDLDSYYVHLFPGIMSGQKKTFDKDPVQATYYNMKYNPKTKDLEVRTSRFFWKKPYWTKNCTYYGDKLKAPTSTFGGWYYDSYNDIIYMILSSSK